MRKGEQFRGQTVAIVTPFTDAGEIDYPALERLIDWHAEQGTDCLAPMGTTGESPTVDHDEHRKAIRATIARVRRSGGSMKVMPGTGSNSTREAISLTKFAKDEGADGALMVGPYYNKPTQEGYLKHFFAVGDAVSLPIVLYNIPGRTASNMLPETICKLGEHPSIVAVKEATGSMDQSSQILAGSNLTVLSGDDSLTLPLLALGASGVVSVVGNIVSKDVRSMLDAFGKGDIEAARGIHYKLFALCRDMLGLATNPIPIKAAMQLLGRGNGLLRLPMTPLDAAGMTKLRGTLTQYGLL
jgi:4-hydroxy-tetrahydrodipicolinate synthase